LTTVLTRLVREAGGRPWDDSNAFVERLNREFAGEPVEGAILSRLVEWSIDTQFERSRGREEPKQYLPLLAKAFSTATGESLDAAMWAVFALHEALDAGARPINEQLHVDSRFGTNSIGASLVVAFAAFCGTGATEFALQKGMGRTLATVSWHRIDHGRNHDAARRDVGRSLLTVAAASGLVGLFAWGLSSAVASRFPFVLGAAAVAGGITDGLINAVLHASRPGFALTLSPVIDLLVLVVLIGFATWSAVAAAAMTAAERDMENARQTGWRMSGDRDWNDD
jgi:hypothetical protein